MPNRQRCTAAGRTLVTIVKSSLIVLPFCLLVVGCNPLINRSQAPAGRRPAVVPTIQGGLPPLTPTGPPLSTSRVPSPTRPLDQLGLIAFTISGRGQDSFIYAMRADGKYLRNLAEGFGKSSNPAWSPDARQIAFISWRDGSQDLYVMKSDGSDVRRLTRDMTVSSRPSWSPDGKRIAFAALGQSIEPDIWLIDLSSPQPVNVTNHPGLDQGPAWSPDGAKIAFQSDRDGKIEVYSMRADGSEVMRLTEDPFPCHSPAWSPDGKKIAFACATNRGTVIETMKPDGSGRVRLINPDDYLDGSDPSWSPDGSRIAFQSIRGQQEQICVMNSDGTGTIQLTDWAALEIMAMQPSWQPVPR